jgi:hypothetical protein
MKKKVFGVLESFFSFLRKYDVYKAYDMCVFDVIP